VYGVITVCVRVLAYYNVNYFAQSQEVCQKP
jgi:hypothetical protein